MPIQITTIEKTIADCFKFRNKVGLDVAIEALKDAGASKRLDRDELWACAKVNRITRIILERLLYRFSISKFPAQGTASLRSLV